jgi:DNA-binding PadR family transcriptional regulator
MPSRRSDVRLSLAGYTVLGLIGEGGAHGFAVARLLSAEGEIGQVYEVARPAVYREIETLVSAGLVQLLPVEPGDRGPRRTPLAITRQGRRLFERWLWSPARHVRDIRTEFLVKLALIERTGRDPSPLIAAQLEAVSPVVAGLVDRHATSRGFDRAVSLWRLKSAQAAQQFLAELATDRP